MNVSDQTGPRPPAPVSAVGTRADGRILDPIDRYSEVLFGLFMVLTFTGTLSVASAGREDVRTMLLTAIGCNAAWGFVDGVMYVLRNLVTRNRRITLGRAVRAAANSEEAHRVVADEIGPLSAGMDAAGLERVRRWFVEHPVPRGTAGPTSRDLKGALVPCRPDSPRRPRAHQRRAGRTQCARGDRGRRLCRGAGARRMPVGAQG